MSKNINFLFWGLIPYRNKSVLCSLSTMQLALPLWTITIATGLFGEFKVSLWSIFSLYFFLWNPIIFLESSCMCLPYGQSTSLLPYHVGDPGMYVLCSVSSSQANRGLQHCRYSTLFLSEHLLYYSLVASSCFCMQHYWLAQENTMARLPHQERVTMTLILQDGTWGK